jgi:hypothetical protein
MTQIVITLIIVVIASIYAIYKLFRSIIPGQQAVKRGCGVGCPHCMQ